MGNLIFTWWQRQRHAVSASTARWCALYPCPAPDRWQNRGESGAHGQIFLVFSVAIFCSTRHFHSISLDFSDFVHNTHRGIEARGMKQNMKKKGNQNKPQKLTVCVVLIRAFDWRQDTAQLSRKHCFEFSDKQTKNRSQRQETGVCFSKITSRRGRRHRTRFS